MRKRDLPEISLQKISEGKEEIVIRYHTMTPQLERLIRQLTKDQVTILGKNNGKQYRSAPADIYYFESVDEKLFAYTKDMALQVGMTLSEAEESLKEQGFFRCNKSFVLNINRIDSVKSELGNRIDATLDNGEHIIISRRYSKQFRERLREDGV